MASLAQQAAGGPIPTPPDQNPQNVDPNSGIADDTDPAQAPSGAGGPPAGPGANVDPSAAPSQGQGGMDPTTGQPSPPIDPNSAPLPSGSSGGTFKAADISKAIPPQYADAVQRIVAAGMKIMYSPASRQDLMAAVKSPDPLPKVLAENITGLMLTLDKHAGGSGLPPPAVMPAAYELLADAGALMVKAGRNVSQQDFTSAVQLMYVMISKKQGMNNDQIMDTAAKAVPGGGSTSDAQAAASATSKVAPSTGAGGSAGAGQLVAPPMPSPTGGPMPDPASPPTPHA